MRVLSHPVTVYTRHGTKMLFIFVLLNTSLSDFFVDASGPNTLRYMAASRNRCLASSFLLVGFEGYPMISVLDAMSNVCCLSHYRYVVH